MPVASVEFAVLDLLGTIARKPLGELFGPIVSRDIPVYRASGNRGNSPEEEIAYLQKLVAETGAKAIKFRLGARMRYDDASTRRDLALIPLTRKTFGEGMAIHADANGSYDVPMALRIRSSTSSRSPRGRIRKRRSAWAGFCVSSGLSSQRLYRCPVLLPRSAASPGR